MALREDCCKGGRQSKAFGTCLAKEGPSSFLLIGSRENMGRWKPPRIASPSQYWLPSLLPASPGLGMVLHTKDADTGQSPVCSLPLPCLPPAAGAPQKGKDAKVGGRKGQVQPRTCPLVQPTPERQGGLWAWPSSCVCCCSSYLTRQLATASPRERATPLEPGKFCVPLGTKVPEPAYSGNPKCHTPRWTFKMYAIERVRVF